MNDFIEENKIIAIMRDIPYNQIKDVTKALYDGGIRIIECTFEHSAENPHEILKRKLDLLNESFNDKMLIGAGTVIDCKQVDTVNEANGKFIVTPNFDKEVILKAKQLNLVTIIGAITPTEIVGAFNCGADYIKIFPAGNLGSSYIKSIKSPLSHIKLMAVGGITLDNIKAFIEAGACGFGIGSPLLPKELIECRNYEAITKIAEQYVKQLNEFKIQR